jgi:hypothetical protein
VDRQIVVAMLENPMKLFAGFLHGINVNDDRRQIRKMVQQLMTHFLGDHVRIDNRQVRGHGHIQLGVKTMT